MRIPNKASLRMLNLRKNKTVLIGVSGGISSYKVCEVVRLLLEKGISINVLMTSNATEFVRPLTFSALTGNPVFWEEFPSGNLPSSPMAHIELARSADVLLIAPATANTMAKIAYGIADNLLTSTVLAYEGPVVLAPAMNTAMWENPATQENVRKLKDRGLAIIEPGVGFLACGESGPGRLPEPEKIVQAVLNILNSGTGPFTGVKALVTGGATREFIDPVRFISNCSTGTLALKCADYFFTGGAEVTFVAGSSVPKEEIDKRGYRFVPCVSAKDMHKTLKPLVKACDVLLMFAAVADFSAEPRSEKIRKEKQQCLELKLKRTEDILESLPHYPNQVRVGVSLDTTDWIEVARRKMQSKKLDAIVGVYLDGEEPFGNAPVNASIISGEDDVLPPARYSKDELAPQIAELALKILKLKRGTNQ